MRAERLLVAAVLGLGCGGGGGGSGGGGTDAPLATIPDLRFKGVGEYTSLTPTLETDVGNGAQQTLSAQGEFWSPVEMGGGSAWPVVAIQPVPGTQDTTAVAISGDGSSEPTDLGGLTGVITSVDFIDTVYGATEVGPSAPDPNLIFNYNGGVDDASFPAYVAAQTGSGAIVTAFGFDGSAIEVYSFGEQGDATTYEAIEMETTADQLASIASAIGGSGYTITAMGHTSTTTFGLVGTRISGSAAPRSVVVVDDPGTSPGSGDDITLALGSGYVVVGAWFDTAGHFIVEK